MVILIHGGGIFRQRVLFSALVNMAASHMVISQDGGELYAFYL